MVVPMYLFISMINIFYFQENDRIFHVKLEISVQTGFERKKIRLYDQYGELLSDGMTLSGCEIGHESKIDCCREQTGC